MAHKLSSKSKGCGEGHGPGVPQVGKEGIPSSGLPEYSLHNNHQQHEQTPNTPFGLPAGTVRIQSLRAFRRTKVLRKTECFYEVYLYAYCYGIHSWSFGAGILVFWSFAIWSFGLFLWSFDLWSFCLLTFWSVGLLVFWPIGLLVFWSFGLLAFGLLLLWYFGLLVFWPLVL